MNYKNTIKENVFFEDGSLRDLCILNITLSDWQKLYAHLREHYLMRMTIDGEEVRVVPDVFPDAVQRPFVADDVVVVITLPAEIAVTRAPYPFGAYGFELADVCHRRAVSTGYPNQFLSSVGYWAA